MYVKHCDGWAEIYSHNGDGMERLCTVIKESMAQYRYEVRVYADFWNEVDGTQDQYTTMWAHFERLTDVVDALVSLIYLHCDGKLEDVQRNLLIELKKL